jgi:hypothetical protein
MTMVEFKEFAIEKSIEHWEKMIAWAKTQNPEDKVSKDLMLEKIGENTCGDYCLLCQYFECYVDAPTCPLHLANHGCNDGDSPWRRVISSPTWNIWIERSNKMLKALKELQ